MKRTLAALVLAAAPLLLTACGEEEPDPTGDSVTENTQDEPSPAATE